METTNNDYNDKNITDRDVIETALSIHCDKYGYKVKGDNPIGGDDFEVFKEYLNEYNNVDSAPENLFLDKVSERTSEKHEMEGLF